MAHTDPSRTLAIFLGASTFPKAPQLSQGRFFYNSAADLMEYMTGADGMQVPRENLLWLFDDSHSAPDQLVEIADFLGRRRLELKSAGADASDLFIFYVGHGSFTRGGDQAYCLAVRNTNAINEGATSMRVGELANVVKENATFMKRYLIFDCCFAGSAAREFQSGVLTAAKVQIKKEFPGSGTALMCAANSEQPAKSPEGLGRTMFSTALIHALRSGHGAFGPELSFSELGDIVRDHLRAAFPNNYVRPEVHSPDQHEGDIAHLPLFPNPGYSASRPVKKPVPAKPAGQPMAATPARPEVAPRSPQSIAERAPAKPVEPKTPEAVRLKPKPEREEKKREEEDSEEKRRASQDAAAERVLAQIRRDRAKRMEPVKPAKQKAAEEREPQLDAQRRASEVAPQQPAQPSMQATVNTGVQEQKAASQPASSSSLKLSGAKLVFVLLILIPLANVFGYYMGGLMAYQAANAFWGNFWLLVIPWTIGGFIAGVMATTILEEISGMKKVKHVTWVLGPGFLFGFIFHSTTTGNDGFAVAISMIAFVVAGLGSAADA